MEKKLFKTESGVKISFTGEVKKESIVKMVENCKIGQCDCMSNETKAKISDIAVSGEDGNVEISLSGTMSQEEIETALKKSTVIENKCC